MYWESLFHRLTHISTCVAQHFTRVVHACTALYMRVIYITRVYTHGVMPHVVLCKLCAYVVYMWQACDTHGLFKLWVLYTVHIMHL